MIKHNLKQHLCNNNNQKMIKFYRASGEYGFLSNLYKKQIKFEGRNFPTSEHAYQFGKFKNEDVRDWAMKAPKPHLLSILAHNLFTWDITPNWNDIKVERMYKILQIKFSDFELKERLLKTEDAILIEDSKTDSFWGIGKKGKGKNMLGKMLMKIREEIKDKANEQKKYEQYCIKCNNEVKLCQTCFFFKPVVFNYEDEYYWDEELGVFTLWIWDGYCLNESMPNIFPALYHKTKSNQQCEWYITKEEYEYLSTNYKEKELSLQEYQEILKKYRKEKEKNLKRR